jgi:hypothetical protein
MVGERRAGVKKKPAVFWATSEGDPMILGRLWMPSYSRLQNLVSAKR